MATNNGLEEIIKNYGELTQFIFHKNDVLFKENDLPAGLYCIESGSVKIFKEEQSEQERILHLATAGEILGLHSVVNNHPYTNSATAISETRASFISGHDFMELINSNNTYKLLVMKSLCSRIDSMEDHIVRISEKMSDERFADTLLVLVDKYGISKAKELNIHLSIDELASYTCTSKSYMKKIITEFTHRGLITFSGGSIKILNLPLLKTTAVLNPREFVN
jgi:CRP/FNR family transcriptional regulator